MTRRTVTPTRRLGVMVATLATVLAGAWVVPSTAATTYSLQVSASADRSGSESLSGSILTGKAYVFLAPTTSVKSVAFYVDDPKRKHKARRVDTASPFDLKGGTAAAATPYSTTGLKDGKHTLTAVITTTGGTRRSSPRRSPRATRRPSRRLSRPRPATPG